MDYRCPDGLRDIWKVGETAFFQYECLQSHDSSDAELWYRSHQRVLIIDDSEELYEAAPDLDLLLKRSEAGQPRVYRVRFQDGFEGCAVEGELCSDPKFWRPEFGPGARPTTEGA